MTRIAGNWVGVGLRPTKPYQRVYRDAELDIKRKHTELDPSPFREETEFGDPREDRAFNERIGYTKQVSDDMGQTWSEPQPCEVTPITSLSGGGLTPNADQYIASVVPRVIQSSKTKLPIKEADEYDIEALTDIRTDQLWELIFQKYRLLEAHMIARRGQEIANLFNRMTNARQMSKSPISDSVLESFKIVANRTGRPIIDNPQA